MATPQALTPEQIQQIIAAGRGNTVNLNGTIYQGNYADTGAGETFQEGALQDIYAYTPEQNKVGGMYNQYDASGNFARTGTQQEVNSGKDFLEFLGGSAALFALPGALNGSLFGGTGLTASELASADMALGGVGGTAGAEALAGAATAGAGAGALSSLTPSQLANLAKAGISVAGLAGAGNAVSNIGGGNTAATGVSVPTQSTPQYTQDYYTQLQNTYNQLMPGVPRDVVSNLASWYGGTAPAQDTAVTGGLFGKELAAVTPPATPTTPVNLGSTAYQYATNQGGMTPMQYLNNINQWILDNPNASLADINAIKSKLGVSDVDVQTALGESNFSDATKYALTHNMGLSDVNQNIVDWLAKNPAATNAQIQAEQAKYSISDADVARALTEQNASAAKEYAIIHDMGLDQYYKNITKAAQSGLSPSDAAAQMKQYGVSPTDVQTAYSMFAPKSGLTLDEVLAAYNIK
jgi:NACalpha-BTF3-like transcription factor